MRREKRKKNDKNGKPLKIERMFLPFLVGGTLLSLNWLWTQFKFSFCPMNWPWIDHWVQGKKWIELRTSIQFWTAIQLWLFLLLTFVLSSSRKSCFDKPLKSCYFSFTKRLFTPLPNIIQVWCASCKKKGNKESDKISKLFLLFTALHHHFGGKNGNFLLARGCHIAK